ncbi:MAG: tetratricopeptide repeat-containing sensor histidine kinase [Saprospiraceae bacterium]
MKATAAEFEQKVRKAEALLSGDTRTEQRFELLQNLIEFYIYTDLKKARNYIGLQAQLLSELNAVNFEVDHLSNLALLANLEYDFEKSETYFLQAIELLEDKISSNKRIDLYLNIAAVFSNQKKFTLAGKYLNLASKMLDRNPDPLLNGYFHFRLAYFYLEEGNFAMAVELFSEAEDIFELYEGILPLKAINFLIFIETGRGRMYYMQGNYASSITHYLKALALCENYGISSRISHHYVNIGSAFMGLNDIAAAENYFIRSIEFEEDSSTLARAIAYSNLGKCSVTRGEYDKAVDELNLSRELFLKNNSKDYFNLASVENYLAELFSLNEKEKKKEKHLKKSLIFAEKSKNQLQIRNVSANLADHYSKTGDFEKAYKYLKKSQTALEHHIHKTKEEEIERLSMIRDIEKSRNEAKIEKMKAVQLQHRALRAQMNPHFMFNLLNAIQSEVNAGNLDVASDNLSSFASLMRESLENSDREIITLEREIDFLNNYIELNQKMRFNSRLDYRIHIDDELEPDIMGVPSMIIQPYVENAIEHGLKSIQKGMLSVSFNLYDDDNIICIVEDNGVGRKVAMQRKNAAKQLKKHRSMGTTITEERLKFIHEDLNQSDLEFIVTEDLSDEHTGEANGTRVSIIIPILELKKYNS